MKRYRQRSNRNKSEDSLHRKLQCSVNWKKTIAPCDLRIDDAQVTISALRRPHAPSSHHDSYRRARGMRVATTTATSIATAGDWRGLVIDWIRSLQSRSYRER